MAFMFFHGCLTRSPTLPNKCVFFEGVCESQVSDQIDFCCSYCHELCQVEIITAENGLHAITV